MTAGILVAETVDEIGKMITLIVDGIEFFCKALKVVLGTERTHFF
jgi:hypothetical protein